MRLLPRPSPSFDYQCGLFNQQERVWLNFCRRVYIASKCNVHITGFFDFFTFLDFGFGWMCTLHRGICIFITAQKK